MTQSKNVLYLVDETGKLQSVQLSLPLWEAVQSYVLKAEQKFFVAPELAVEPLEDLATLKEYWDFKYPYSPEVSCKHCHSFTKDWEHDPERPFRLTNANLGGLLAFNCKKCGSTVRMKHFKDHVALECTPHPSSTDKK